MFTIKTKLGVSEIHGIGVFVEEFVPAGKVMWEYLADFDMIYTDSEFKELPESVKEFILHYAYYNKSEGGHVLCGDHARFTNHSKNPNTKSAGLYDVVATRDIAIGEEITEDYRTFDELCHFKDE